MDAKHTPGPWSFYDCAAYGSHITRGGIGGQMIASVQQYVGISADAYKANRALISAAPEMFDALVGLCDSLADAFTNSGPMTAVELLNAVRQQTESARAAIAKARGA